MNQVSQMYKDALMKVHKALPSLNGVESEQLSFEPDTILPWYDRFAWRFGPKDGYHVVVVIGGHSANPIDVTYLSHISYRPSTECTFHCFQVSNKEDATHADLMIDFYLRLNLKQDPASTRQVPDKIEQMVNKVIYNVVDEKNLVNKDNAKAYNNWKPGQDLPDETTDDYILYGKIHTHGDIIGLKELYVDSIIIGDRFYVPLPAYIGGSLDEQKFLIGIARKDIPASAIRLGYSGLRYPTWTIYENHPSKPTEQMANNDTEATDNHLEEQDLGYEVTKEPFKVNFACNECGCEFNLPAHKCERQKIETSCEDDSPNETQFAAMCPRCGTKCKVKRITITGQT